MATPYLATFTSPEGTGVQYWPVLSLECNWEFNDPATCGIVIDTFFNEASGETTGNNPVQLNSLLTITRSGVTIFRGYAEDKRLLESQGGEQMVEVTCFDRSGKLLRTYAGYSGDKLFTRTTPKLDIDNVALHEVAAIGDVKFPYYPANSSAAWLSNANTTALSGAINNSVLTITLTTTTPLFSPAGFVQIDSELIQYSAFQNTGSGGKYVLTVPSGGRGVCGTTAASHSDAATVTERYTQKIHPWRSVKLEGDDGGGYKVIVPGVYGVNVEDSRFEATFSLAGKYTSGVRGTYGVFDEDHASAVNAQDLFVKALEETVANGGPGWTSSQYNLTNMDQIVFTRIDVDSATPTYDYLRNLLSDIGLITGEADDPVGCFFNSQDGKLYINFIQQAGTATLFYEQADSIDRDLTLDQVAGAIIVEWTEGVNTNLLSSERMMHPNLTGSTPADTIGSNSLEVDAVEYQTGPDEPRHDGYASDTTVDDRTLRLEYLVDGEENDTAWGLKITQTGSGSSGDGPSPGTGTRCVIGWFDAAEDTYEIEYAKLIADARRISAGDAMPDTDERQPFNISLKGITDFASASPPTDWSTGNVGTEVALSAALEYNIPNSGSNNIDTDNLGQVILEADGIGVSCNAVVVCSDGWSGNRAGNIRWLLVKQIYVRGRKKKTVLVSLTNNTSTTDPTKVLNVNAYDKLFDATNGEPRVERLELGNATRDVAISLGRLALLAALKRYETRTFTYKRFKSVPVLGNTVCCDGYTGVVMGIALSYTPEDGETLVMRVLDFTAEIS